MATNATVTRYTGSTVHVTIYRASNGARGLDFQSYSAFEAFLSMGPDADVCAENGPTMSVAEMLGARATVFTVNGMRPQQFSS